MICELITESHLLHTTSVALATRRSAALYKDALEEVKAEMKTRKALQAQFGDLAMWTATWRSKTVYDLPPETATEVEQLEAKIERLKKPHARKVAEGSFVGQLHLRVPPDLREGGGAWYAMSECSDAEVDAAVAEQAMFRAGDGTLYVRVP